MTSQRRSSDHSHTGNQVGCEHRIGQQDGPHSTADLSPAVTLHCGSNGMVHGLPNGLRVTFSIGHVDRMPRCEVTGLATAFCSHCFHIGENSRV